MIRLLLITSHFPPEISGGVGRPNSLFRHLPSHGIDVEILTLLHKDSNYQSDKIFRTSSLNSFDPDFRKFYFWFLRFINKIIKICGGHNSLDIRWLISALQLLIKKDLIRSYSCLYVTFPSINPIIIALYLNWKYGVPYVVEFRDGLTFEPLVKMSPLQTFITKYIEKKVISNANSVVTVGRTISADLSVKYTKNINTVHNGFDASAIFNNVSESELNKELNKNNKLTFVYFGNITYSKPRDVRFLFEGIKCFLNARYYSESVQFIFYGRFSKHERELVEEKGLVGAVIFMPPVNADMMAKIGRCADFLLFYGVPGDRGFISAKLMEYLSYARPILGICSGNEAEEIINSAGVGLVTDFDPQSIADGIEKLVQTRTNFKFDIAKLLLYSREAQAEKIYKIIINSKFIMNHKVD
jgi:glycosyltransferase involved in cell wall biosynthesis